MANQYYYFIAGLPGLGIDDTKSSITVEMFLQDASKQLSGADYRLLKLLRLPDDLDNLLRSMYNREDEFKTDSEYPKEFWQEYLAFVRQKAQDTNMALPAKFKALPGFVHNIVLDCYAREEMPALIKVEHQLLAALYDYCGKHSNAFIRDWFAFEATLKNILIAINGRKHEVPYADFLIGEGELVEKLAKSHAPDFGLGKENELFESLWRLWEQNNILYRERGYDVLRWKWIDAQNFFQYFNIDRILGYFCKLRILERWLKMDPSLGKDIFQDTLDALENSFSFPPQFKVKSISNK